MNSKTQRIVLMIAIGLALVMGVGFLYGGLVPLLAGTGEATVGGIMAHNSSYFAYTITGGLLVLGSLLAVTAFGHYQRQQRLFQD